MILSAVVPAIGLYENSQYKAVGDSNQQRLCHDPECTQEERPETAHVIDCSARAENAELTYAEGYPADNSLRQDLLDEAVTLAGSTDVALLYIALPTFKESEGYDRTDLDLTGQEVALIQAVAKVQPKTVKNVISTDSSQVGAVKSRFPVKNGGRQYCFGVEDCPAR